MEAGHKSAGGVADHVLHSAGLQRPTMMENAQTIAEQLGLLEIVGDEHHGNADLAAKLRELEPEPPPRELIDGGERLVEQQNLRGRARAPAQAPPAGAAPPRDRPAGALPAPPC